MVVTSKLRSNRHHQQTNMVQLFTGRMPFLTPNQQCQSTKGKKSFNICFFIVILLLGYWRRIADVKGVTPLPCSGVLVVKRKDEVLRVIIADW